MPRVPEYSGPQVARQPIADAHLQPIANDAGQQIAQAGAQFGASLAQAADSLNSFQVHRDEGAVKDAAVQYKQLKISALYNPETGLLARQGSDALDLAPTIKAQLAGKQAELLDGMQNARQRTMLGDYFTQDQFDTDQVMGVHLAKQAAVYNDQRSTALIDTNAEAAATAHDADPLLALTSLRSAQDEQAALDARRGVGPEASAINQLSLSSRVYRAVAERQVALNDLTGALRVLTEHAGEMLGQDRNAMLGPVREALADQDADAVAAGVIKAGVAGFDPSEYALHLESGSMPHGVHAGAAALRTAAQAAGADADEAESQVQSAFLEGSFNLARDLRRTSGDGEQHLAGLAGQRLAQERSHRSTLAQTLGREPTIDDVHLARTVGAAGAPALLNAPAGAGAQAVLQDAGMTLAQAKAAIERAGGRSGVTAAELVDHIVSARRRTARSGVEALAAAPQASATPDVLPDYETGRRLMRAWAGGDPRIQAKALAAYDRRFGAMKQTMVEGRARLDDQAQAQLLAGKGWSQWPLQLRASITPQDANAFMQDEARRGREAAGVEPRLATDPNLYAQLLQEGAADPDALLARPLSSYIGQLAEPDRAVILKLRGDARVGGGSTGVRTDAQLTAQRVMDAARQVLGEQGVDLTGPVTPDHSLNQVLSGRQAFADLTRNLLEADAIARRETGRPASDEDLLKAADRYVMTKSLGDSDSPLPTEPLSGTAETEAELTGGALERSTDADDELVQQGRTQNAVTLLNEPGLLTPVSYAGGAGADGLVGGSGRDAVADEQPASSISADSAKAATRGSQLTQLTPPSYSVHEAANDPTVLFRLEGVRDPHSGADKQPSFSSVMDWAFGRLRGKGGPARAPNRANPTRNVGPSRPSAERYDASNLNLGVNTADYYEAITTSTREGPLTPHMMAAIYNIEAPKSPKRKGRWMLDKDADKYTANPFGPGQFSGNTWIRIAERKGGSFNNYLKREGLLDSTGRVPPENRLRVLSLRNDIGLTSLAMAEEGPMAVTLFGSPKWNLIPSGADSTLIGKMIYLYHHEGGENALRIMLNRTGSFTRNYLFGQIHDSAKVDQLIKDAGGDAGKAYQTWIYSLADSMNPDDFASTSTHRPQSSIKEADRTWFAKRRRELAETQPAAVPPAAAKPGRSRGLVSPQR